MVFSFVQVVPALSLMIGILSLCLLTMLLWLGRKGKTYLKTGSPYPEGRDMKPFMFLNILYVNNDDPRGWLPKSQPGMGWTVNFRSKSNARVFLILLSSIIGLSLMTLLFTFMGVNQFA